MALDRPPQAPPRITITRCAQPSAAVFAAGENLQMRPARYARAANPFLVPASAFPCGKSKFCAILTRINNFLFYQAYAARMG
ncbi:MAG TPA: hypothetical protein VGE12_02560 [Noviherbaspirillum sp.]